MAKESLNKKIDNCFEIRKSLWTVVMLLTGSLCGLIFSMDFSVKIISILKYFITGIGIFLDYLFILSMISINKEIDKLIEIMEKGE